ncbi:arsenate reductase family protein [Fusibacter paucivorans]|uniref:Arsenate reductase family protein n=1 Tax=Fusibacter paucivorans TaxID=76009 RepID=A0ABS5PUA3_9FIRM|nr:arsenate reductase family protein [Fusibacter paucivorans]MBS7528749.1 arsenate reductase family protein [Fusibacter paucivorans]
MLFICYPKCSTCKKAEKFLKANGLDYTFRDISVENPTQNELNTWLERSGLPIKKFFNTSGQSYRALNLKDKLGEMTTEAQIALLATDGMLVKRPILVTDDGSTVLVGFKENEWTDTLLP